MADKGNSSGTGMGNARTSARGSSSPPPPVTSSAPPLPTITITPPVDVPAATIIPATGAIICREMTEGIPCLKSFDTLQQYFGHLRMHPERKHRGGALEKPTFKAHVPLPTKLLVEKPAADNVVFTSHPEITHRGIFDPAGLIPSKLLDEKIEESVASILPNALLEIARRQLEKIGGEEGGSSSGGLSLRPDGLIIDVNETPKRDSVSPPKKQLKIDVNKTPPNSSDENESSPSN